MSTGAGITLIAAGAILRSAVATTSTHGLNVHAVGVILILAGVLGLLLSLLVWGPLNRRPNHPASYDHTAPPLTRQRFPARSHRLPAAGAPTRTSRQTEASDRRPASSLAVAGTFAAYFISTASAVFPQLSLPRGSAGRPCAGSGRRCAQGQHRIPLGHR